MYRTSRFDSTSFRTVSSGQKSKYDSGHEDNSFCILLPALEIYGRPFIIFCNMISNNSYQSILSGILLYYANLPAKNKTILITVIRNWKEWRSSGMLRRVILWKVTDGVLASWCPESLILNSSIWSSSFQCRCMRDLVAFTNTVIANNGLKHSGHGPHTRIWNLT